MEVAPPAGATIGILCFSVTSATAAVEPNGPSTRSTLSWVMSFS